MNKQHSFHSTVLGLRHVALASALCCAGLAQAQVGPPGVTLYGLVDVGITSVSGLSDGAGGTTTKTQIASGIMEGSRWGLKGNEDLGGGYKAIFTLESRFEADTGSLSNRPISGSQLSDRFSDAGLLGLPTPPNPYASAYQTVVDLVSQGIASKKFGVNLDGNVFDRQAYVGLITPFGAILAGRQYTPAYETFGTFDTMETQSALSAGQIAQFPAVFEIRNSNALAYRIVKNGFSGALMYAPGEVAGDSSASSLMGANVGYKNDTFAVGIGYNTKNNELGDKSLTSTVLGASMNFAGSSKVSALVATFKDDNPSGLSEIAKPFAGTPLASFAVDVQNAYVKAAMQDGTLYHIGYRYVAGARTISVAYNQYNDSRPANADVRSYGAAYTYALSKRTDLNAVVVRLDNKNLAQVAPGGNGYLGGVTASAATDSTGLAFGIRHRF